MRQADPISDKKWWWRGALLLATILFIGPSTAAQANTCVKCHDDVQEELSQSIHGKQGVSCEKCHGGDPTQEDADKAKAPGTGYTGIPDKKQIVERCGNCHADVETMNFYGIRTDQLARYRTSMHGKKLLNEGDENVAACTDCHGYHGVVKVSEPSSPVHPLNVPQTCNTCHGKADLMDKYGLPSDIYSKYKDSVHGHALLDKKDISVAQCASCHGSHGAMPPGVSSVGDTCGKCHMNEKKFFLESPHAKLTDADKFFGCVSCHGNHGVTHPDPQLFGTACAACHAPESDAFRKGKEISRLIEDTGKAQGSAQSAIKQASIEGFNVEDENAWLEELHSVTTQMHPAQHTLNYEHLSQLQKKAWLASEKIQTSLETKRKGRKHRMVSLAMIWAFILVMVAALWTRYKQLEREREK